MLFCYSTIVTFFTSEATLFAVQAKEIQVQIQSMEDKIAAFQSRLEQLQQSIAVYKNQQEGMTFHRMLPPINTKSLAQYGCYILQRVVTMKHFMSTCLQIWCCHHDHLSYKRFITSMNRIFMLLLVSSSILIFRYKPNPWSHNWHVFKKCSLTRRQSMTYWQSSKERRRVIDKTWISSSQSCRLLEDRKR
jgi:hypothetical protein